MQIKKSDLLTTVYGLLVDFCIEFVGDANAWWDEFYIPGTCLEQTNV